jgi:hypothetical protein
LSKEKANIIKDFAPEKKEKGIAALASLETALTEFQKLVDEKDKQV